MAETAQVFQYVLATMQADSQLVAAATGGFWNGYADVGVTAPYVLYSRQGGNDILTMNVNRLWADVLLQIKAVGPASNYPALVTISKRIDALFHPQNRGPYSTPSGILLQSHRQQEIAYDEPALVNGVQYSNLGGLYLFSMQGS